jgi:hypothetical protein
MMRAALMIAALLSPFFFPWKFSILIAFIVSLFIPFSGIATGLIADTLYYNPALSMLPWATIAALTAALIAYGVRSFAKTRIIGL